MPLNLHPSLNLIAPDVRSGSRNNLPYVTTVIPWRTWEQGLEESRSRKLPILALAEPIWANSAQRIAFILEQQPSLASLLSSHVVPVLIDPDGRPDLVTAWRWASVSLTGAAGPPLMVFLTHDGQPFLSYCSMTIDGDDLYPSLASLTRAISEEYSRDPEPFLAEARNLLDTGAVTSIEGLANDGWRMLRPQLDLVHGGLNELPRHPHPSLLWSALEAHERDEAPEDVVAWLSTTLDAMVKGGIYDQLDRGFHRCSRDSRWILPHFEKPVPLNSQLAAVYARASRQLRNQQYRDIANHLIGFCSAALGDGIDVIGSDSGYYTWTAREILNALEPALVQVVSLHYDVTPIPNRQALYRAVDIDDMERFSHEDVSILRSRLVKGRAQLRLRRQSRPSPPLVASASFSWRAETIRWVLIASAWSRVVDVPDVVGKLEQLIGERLDSTQGYLRQSGTAWLEDQAALLAAFVAAYKATDSGTWLERSRELADILLSSYRSDIGWLDRPGSATRSVAVIDDILPSALRTVELALDDLAGILENDNYAAAALELREMNRSLMLKSEYWPALITPEPR